MAVPSSRPPLRPPGSSTLLAMAADLDTLLAPGYPGDLSARSMEEVRKMRAECQSVETGLSMLRRVVQGRLDIVGLELARRAEGGDPADLSSLIDKLPEVLSDRTLAPGVGRLPQVMVPGEMPAELEAELDAIVGDGQLADLPALSDDDLSAVASGLEAFEHKVSGLRRELFDRIDALQAEITRRYKSGEASIDSLLS